MRTRRNGVGRYFTHYRTHAGDTDDKHQPVSENSKDEVSYRSGSNDGGALSNCFIVEGAVSQLRGDRLNAFVEHFDVAAQRDEGDDKFRTVTVGARPERFAKTDGKPLYPHTATASNPEMAKFMHGNQHTQCNNERRQIPENAQHKTFR